jgi:hypothetical protein
MSRAYDYYRTPDQSEVEEQERLEYLEYYNREKAKQKEKEDSDKEIKK